MNPEKDDVNPGDDAALGTPGTGEVDCPACKGTGRKDGASCPTCNGTGKVVKGVGGA
jgi:DnaJ-class molecular chaperone